MKELIFAQILALELGKKMKYKLKNTFQVYKVREDNIGAQNLANNKGQSMSSRTKYICINYCWFQNEVKPSEIEIKRIDAKIQGVKNLTKGMTRFNSSPIY